MNEPCPTPSFADVLASSVHDIKNSLTVVISTLDDLLRDPRTQIADRGRATLLQLEAQRANHNLIQLLSMYKLGRQQLAANISEQVVEDFIDELVAENRQMAETMGLALHSHCESTDTGYFDDSLIRGVLNSTIGNATRYTHTQILISADQQEGYLVLRVEDDGAGYPPAMLEAAECCNSADAFRSGHTQLGLVFAREIAALHRSGDRQGFIRLRNTHTLRGGCFELWLP